MKQVSKTNAIAQQVKTMTAEPIPADPVLVISPAEQTMLIEYVQINNQASNKNQQLAELLYSKGKRSYHFVGANDEDKSLVAFRNQIISIFVKGFDADAQKLYHAEPKTLSVSKGVERTVLVTKVLPTLFGNAKKAMAKLENNIASGKTEKAKPKTSEQMAKQYIQKAIEQIGKCKNGWEGMLKDKQALESLAVLKQVK
jgi:hypothetical protein